MINVIVNLPRWILMLTTAAAIMAAGATVSILVKFLAWLGAEIKVEVE